MAASQLQVEVKRAILGRSVALGVKYVGVKLLIRQKLHSIDDMLEELMTKTLGFLLNCTQKAVAGRSP